MNPQIDVVNTRVVLYLIKFPNPHEYQVSERTRPGLTNLNIVSSAFHTNTLSISTGELMRQAGAQLKVDT